MFVLKNFKIVFSYFPIVLQYILNVALICLGVVLSVFLMKEVIQFIQELKLDGNESSYHLIIYCCFKIWYLKNLSRVNLRLNVSLIFFI
ncbi:hypothetical protein BK751_25165 [Bacillus thuringiensis serovar galleriae]|jgi:phosphate starvation-inducible membrane PsiE|uniref:Uncharacterized protein n=2 Tax=Bacillus thuringiensis TaxID=1428 RepID=A0A9X6KNG9_BACTU|nr:hypothetical protein BVH75_15060 [Bacillus thuringiensis]OTW71354.1 hypothetical protein BK701_02805 [Bacillus thuringiensis serovar amagiensis]OTY60571.1 hypothetical protein BK747_21100 [Bacillus thuringiensis serovar azorensis]OTY63474.1 hypothetical protein BK746_03765 [Bacillus thuringiensis serovar yosoo]OTY83674.1 hypothetical protein BK751_25165 [Bacillus thuringiensis serovar galleriae]OTY89423.1 hypothetical protein BK755_10395 [Bacillus thuringiensis serovar aizawai]OTZ27620.1 h